MTAITIPLTSLPVFEKAVAKINRRATKLGFEKIEVELGAKSLKFFAERTSRHGFDVATTQFQIEEDKYIDLLNNNPERLRTWTVEVIEVTYSDVTHGFEGHKIVGVTENIEGIHTLNTFDEKFDLTEERGTCKCDHCGYDRNRNKVYFVNKEGENGFIRLGSSCVSHYFVNENVSGNALSKFKLLEEIHNLHKPFDEEESCWGYSSHQSAYLVKELLRWTVFTVAESGYVSVAKARDNFDVVATKDQVTNNIHEEEVKLELTEKQEKQAEELYEWAKEQGAKNEYFNTVQQIIEQGYCPVRLAGYIIGVYGWWNSDNNKRIETEANKSQHVGTVGERCEFNGKVVKVRSFDGHYGTSYQTTVVCGDDTVIYWNRLNEKGGARCAEEGDAVTFFAKVKDHGEFNGVPQTIVQRATKVGIAS